MEILAILGLVAYGVGLAIMETRSDYKYLDKEACKIYEMPELHPWNRGLPEPNEEMEESEYEQL